MRIKPVAQQSQVQDEEQEDNDETLTAPEDSGAIQDPDWKEQIEEEFYTGLPLKRANTEKSNSEENADKQNSSDEDADASLNVEESEKKEKDNKYFVDNYDHGDSNVLYTMLGPGLSKIDEKPGILDKLKELRQKREEVRYGAYNKYIMSRKSKMIKKTTAPDTFAKKQKVERKDFIYD